MKKPLYSLIFIIIIGILFSVFSFRLDLTKEKRYTLSDTTIKTLKQVKAPMKIKVFLKGDFPASFQQLSNETVFLLEEMRKENPNVDYELIDPIASKMSQDTLMAMGVSPSKLPDFKDGKISEIILFPYAAIQYKRHGSSVPLIINQMGISAAEQLNKSIENLEYAFTSTIKDLVQEKKKNIGFLVNQQELGPNAFGSFVEMALENYNIGPIIPNEVGSSLGMSDYEKIKKMDAIICAKPREKFTDQEKLILDQYIMNGGKTLWMVDGVNAEMDTLYRSAKIMAFAYDQNMTDFFFNYGVRINTNLVKDMSRAANLRVQAGEIQGNPQYNNLMWPYFPLGIADKPHPITNHISPVKLEFPSSIDTLSRKNIKTTVLFESSKHTITKTTPVYVDINEMANLDSLQMSEKASNPKIFSVLLEGYFSSAYAQRSERNAFSGFKMKSPANKMIVIADGDVAKNAFGKGEKLPLGYDLLTDQTYGNAAFLQNCLDYLLDDDNLMQLRNRNIGMRLLDLKKINDEKQKWQMINLFIPLLCLAVFAYAFYYWRKKKYTI